MAFKEYLIESENKTVAVLFGRMNPPTAGHEENVEGLKKLAAKHDADHLVIASHSQDAKKNPLTAPQKLKHLKRAFPKTNVITSSKEKPTIFHHLSELHKKGYKHVIIAGGSDRAEEYNKLKAYNGKEGKHGYYNFKSITTASTGERKAGVSGTDMRKHATNNDFASFRKHLPTKLAAHEGHAKDLFHDVRSGMGLHEIYDPHLKVSKYQWGETKGANKMRQTTPGEKVNIKPVREQYVNGEIFKIGQLVETSGNVGKITYRGSNYVTVTLNEGRVIKCWLEDVKEIEFARNFVSFKNKIPYLLMNEQQKENMGFSKPSSNNQLEFDGIQTKNFNLCPGAYKEFKSMIETIRANKHIGETTGHHQDEPPSIEKGLKQTSDVVRKVQAGIAIKPKHIRKMQFKQYLEL